MPIKIESQAEPIPGYKLIERLGGGGFGEVWKCIAPGGLFKAIKFVYGDLSTDTAPGGDTSRADQELKALSRVKSVHHPYILSLERYDIIDGQLLIVMELADRTLGDRFKECRQQGLPGIPREEILSYLREVAEALDLMNSQYGLQHLDIKPQNLFLSHNHVKVADFGLVKALEGKVATVTGGVTPVYAAPETFDGLVSRFTDQYSLAIVYQEMLTGQRPFSGTTMRQLVLQHLQGKPDLSSLPTRDRPVIARALAKNPDERFPNCLEMVEALLATKSPSGSADIPQQRVSLLPQQQAEEEPQPIDRPIAISLDDSEDTTTTRGIRKPSSAPAPQEPEPVSSLARAELFTRRSSGSAAAAPVIESADDFSENYSTTTRQRRARAGTSRLMDGVLQPAVVIGLGETGRNALRNLRREMFDQFGSSDFLPHIRFLHIDTDVDAPQAATTGPEDVSLRNSEVLITKLQRASHYLKPRDGKVPVESWMNSKLLYHIPRQEKASAKIRALGRLAFVDHCRAISRRLEAEIQTCCDPQTIKKACEETGLKLRSSTPRVYIITSLAGGTGSGMLIDLAYLAKSCLRRFASDRPEVIGVLLLPQVQGNNRSPGFANSVAALMELHYFSGADAEFQARYDLQDGNQGRGDFKEIGPAFQRCLLLPLPALAAPQRRSQAQKKPTDTLALAGQYVFADLTTPLGAAWDGEQRSTGRERSTRFRTCGTYRILWPRRQFLDKASRLVCRKLIAHWMSKDASAVKGDIEPWAQEQWDANGLRTESLIMRHQESCEKALKQTPEQMFAGVLAPLATPPPAPGTPEPPVNLTVVAHTMASLERMIGIPDECRPETVAAGGQAEHPELGAIEKALADAGATLASDCEHKLSSLIVELIENPRFRLAGAEEAIRQFSTAVAKSLEHHEQLAKELHERAVSLHQRIHALLDAPVATVGTVSKSIWPFSRKSATPTPNGQGSQILELVRSYPKCRYQSLVLSHITRLYVSLRGLLSDQMRELGFCRQRLTELTSWVDNRPSYGTDLPQAAAPGLLAEQCLLPAGFPTVDDAVRGTIETIRPEELQEFDREIQVVLAKHFRALVHVCLAHSNVLKTLSPAMLIEAEEFVEKRIGEVDVVDMYLARHHSEGDVLLTADLAAGFEQAAISLPTSNDVKEETFVAVPVGSAGDRLIEIAQKTLAGARYVRTDRHDLIALVRESGLQLADLEHLGPAGHEVYFAGADPTFLHTRVDITQWRPETANT